MGAELHFLIPVSNIQYGSTETLCPPGHIFV